MKAIKVPQSLTDYLNEQLIEGKDIFAISDKKDDFVTWIVVDVDINWYVICQWFVGDDKYQIVNLTPSIKNKLLKMLKSNELEDKQPCVD